MKKSMRKNTDAVSPVVGVMLMLAVTVILAAVVSAYAGGTVMPARNAPSGTFSCKIVNGGTWDTAGFTIDVLSVSEPVPTRDVKLITSWRASDGTADTVVTAGPPGKDTNSHYSWYKYHAPLGYGPNIDWDPSEPYTVNQFYGNYSLVAGTTLYASPCGKDTTTGGYGVTPATRYEYYHTGHYSTGGYTDSMRAVLGREWNKLRSGDKVNVKLTHVPTGTVLFEKDVTVEA